MFYVLFFKKKPSQPKFRNIILLFLLKIGRVGRPVDQQINLVSPKGFFKTKPDRNAIGL